MPATVLVAAPAQPRWREVQRTLRRHRALRVVGHLGLGSALLEQAAALAPDLLLVAADGPEAPLVPLVRDLRAASPPSRIVVLGAAPLLESTTLLALAGLGVSGQVLWEDLQPGTLARALALVAQDNLLVGSRGVLDHLLAPLERRHSPRIDGLVLSEQERDAFQATPTGAPARPPQATLWEENADFTAIVRTIGALAGLTVTVAASAEAVLAEAARARAGDFLVIDCSLALEEDMARCARVVTQTMVPLYIIHPRQEIVEEVRGLAHGEVTYLAPREVGLSLLERFRLVQAQTATVVPPAPATTLSAREYEVWRLLARHSGYGQIAEELGISASTVKSVKLQDFFTTFLLKILRS